MITRKSRDQIALMRRAGKVVAEMHEVCIRAAKPGATTLDVDRAAREVIERRGARSNFLGYHGFPAVVCTSPNDVIVHGIPSDTVVLEDGDILSIDCGAIIEGWHADAAVTVPVGEIDDESKRLIQVTRGSLEAAIDQVVEGRQLGDIGAAVEGKAEAAGFTVVREYVGHGIGTAMHEDPQVPNYGPPGKGMRLKVGHVLAIEPMVNAGGPETETLDDGWTVVTRTDAAPPTSSTPSPSPTTTPRSSPSPGEHGAGVGSRPFTGRILAGKQLAGLGVHCTGTRTTLPRDRCVRIVRLLESGHVEYPGGSTPGAVDD